MQIPLDFWNVSLFLAVTAIILLVTAQLISAYEGEATILVEKGRLRNAALATDLLFLITVALRVYGIITQV